MRNLLILSTALLIIALPLEARRGAKKSRAAQTDHRVHEIASEEAFSAYVSKATASKPLVVKFHAEWCGACKMMHPDFESVAKKLGDSATFISVDTDKFDDLASTFGVDGLPTTVVIRTESGALNEESLTKLIQP